MHKHFIEHGIADDDLTDEDIKTFLETEKDHKKGFRKNDLLKEKNQKGIW